MALIEKFNHFFKKKINFSTIQGHKINFFNQKFAIFLSLLFLVFITLIIFGNSVKKKEAENLKNFKDVTESTEFFNLSNYLISKIESPYKEEKYIIQNNDTIEKILKRYKIRNEDIKKVSNKLKQRKLSNIYTGREMSLIYKKLNDGSKTIINLLFPINNTTSIELERYKKDLL